MGRKVIHGDHYESGTGICVYNNCDYIRKCDDLLLCFKFDIIFEDFDIGYYFKAKKIWMNCFTCSVCVLILAGFIFLQN